MLLAGTCETEGPAADTAEEALPAEKTEAGAVADTSVGVVGPHDVVGFAVPLVVQQASGTQTELTVDTIAVEVKPHRVADDGG